MKKTKLSLPVLFVVMLFAIAASAHMKYKPKGRIQGFTKHFEKSLFEITRKGYYSVEMIIKGEVLKQGKNEIDLVIHDNKDSDVTGAEISLQPWMLDMGHGIDIEPQIEEKGGGLYHVSNLVITMGGHWQLRVMVSKNGVTDTAVFDFPEVSGMMMHGHVKRPQKIDTSRTQISEKGLYRVSYKPDIEPIRINTLHAWEVTIKDRKGRPVTGARITITGDMPEHGHGLPTEPQMVEELPGGRYIIDGMKFQMPGWWVVKLHIHSPEGMDTVTFQLDLK
jgi:hypothetical protein